MAGTIRTLAILIYLILFLTEISGAGLPNVDTVGITQDQFGFMLLGTDYGVNLQEWK
ncbi:MAG: hypothetical protein KAR19_08595 [Bacteroidales bacterium]|nr:hypothetical protein [Bacteroidales bacterium]